MNEAEQVAAIQAYVEAARRKTGLGKVALAEHLGLDYETMRRWLTGSVPQTVRAMVELVNLAGEEAAPVSDIVLSEILDNTRQIKARLDAGIQIQGAFALPAPDGVPPTKEVMDALIAVADAKVKVKADKKHIDKDEEKHG